MKHAGLVEFLRDIFIIRYRLPWVSSYFDADLNAGIDLKIAVEALPTATVANKKPKSM